MKIWTADGKPIHKLDNFLSTISGICYVPRSKTVWVAAGTSYAVLYDPKSGDNVSSLPYLKVYEFTVRSGYNFSSLPYLEVMLVQCLIWRCMSSLLDLDTILVHCLIWV